MRRQITKALSWFSAAAIAIGLLAGLTQTAIAQGQGRTARPEEGQAAAPTIDAATGKILNEAIELLNMENYSGANQKIATLNLQKLSPYERSKVEQILFSISYAEEKYDEARAHLKAAIDAGGLNEQEISSARYQSAQLYMQEEMWKEGAAALEEWFKTAVNANSAAYYLLAVAYYQQDDYARALSPAQKAVELMDKPQESWINLLLALYVQRDQYREAIPLLERLIAIAPEKKTYWLQLSSLYGQLEDYPNALASMQIAYSAGLVTEDTEIRRLADLLLFNDVPYRGAQVLETAIEKKTVKLDDKLYEKLANCWIAAAEFDKAIAPLQRAGELSTTGDMFVRLGEVQAQREDWAGAAAALQRGIDKGQLKDLGNAQLWMGISLFNQKKFDEARQWFNRARSSEKHRKMATDYIQLIDTQL
ncbi:MAG TPA: tetratricopeptide repeat protein [Gammaproteobacteria bacterium]|nr:tetratricopeptide repeat protein [Gammaproteobacteria bacterium]